MGIRRAIEARGLKMGRDVSVIIFDDDLSYLRNGDDLPIFTATRSSVREAGRLGGRDADRPSSLNLTTRRSTACSRPN